jgi:hypothetical protein
LAIAAQHLRHYQRADLARQVGSNRTPVNGGGGGI